MMRLLFDQALNTWNMQRQILNVWNWLSLRPTQSLLQPWDVTSNSWPFWPPLLIQIKAVDNGRPQKWSTTRLHIEWISKPKPSQEPISFEESFFTFTVMESDPVAHMIGVIAVEPPGTPLWFDIVGKRSSRRSPSSSALYHGEPVYAFLIFVHVSEK